MSATLRAITKQLRGDVPNVLQCDNCNFTARTWQMQPVKDIGQRIDVGGVYTDKECPHCGALCYPVTAWGIYTALQSLVAEHEKETSVEVAMAALGVQGLDVQLTIFQEIYNANKTN